MLGALSSATPNRVTMIDTEAALVYHINTSSRQPTVLVPVQGPWPLNPAAAVAIGFSGPPSHL
jgi:hypothetical protein